MIDLLCSKCHEKMSLPDELAGKTTKCMWCGAEVTVGAAALPPAAPEPDFSNLRETRGQYEPRRYNEDEGGSNPLKGWLIFLLIFGLGNLILYSTTGFLLIPIRR